MISQYNPMGKRILIQIQEDKQEFAKSKGGIILTTETVEKKYVTAKVVLVGELAKELFTEGDLILVNKLKTEEIEIEGEKYNIAHCDDVSFKIR